MIPKRFIRIYTRALLAGLVNTLMLGTISIAISAGLGTAIGTARLSQYKLVNLLASIYVQLFRNISLILQAFFWCTLASNLPPPRAAISAPSGIFLSSGGVLYRR